MGCHMSWGPTKELYIGELVRDPIVVALRLTRSRDTICLWAVTPGRPHLVGGGGVTTGPHGKVLSLEQRHQADLPLTTRNRQPPTEDDTCSDKASGSLLGTSRAKHGAIGNVKLPPFSGKEPWQVWFRDVADRYH